ncbi:MAG: thioredoxin family protein [Chloroflexi bacterium]|nr:thioredoxin family protein [Chloroflexota bacterium]
MGKKFLIFVVFVLLLSACRSDSNDTTEDNVSDLQILGASSSVTLDENRVVITLWDGENRVADAEKLTVSARENDEVIWHGVAASYADYEIPYWVVYPEFSHSGPWILELEIERTDGRTQTGTLGVQVLDAPVGVPAGETALASQNRTWDGEGELRAISSDPDPNPAFYEKTVAEALDEEKPIVVIFSTPGLCQSKICAPVMRTIEPLWEDYQDEINFIHIEVYNDFETLSWVKEMAEWQLQTEPWVYVIDSKGTIVTRLDGPVARSELEPVLQDVMAQS